MAAVMGGSGTAPGARAGWDARTKAIAFTAVTALVALALLSRSYDGTPPSTAVLLIAVAFALADVAVVHVHLRRETFSWSLSEIVLAVALVHAAPVDLVIGQFVGLAVALTVHRRQPLVKLAFNLAQTALATQVAILVAGTVAWGADPMSPQGLSAVLLGVTAFGLTSGALVQAVIALVSGRSAWRAAPVNLLSNALAGLGSACLALQAVALIDLSAWGVVPVAVSSAVLFAAYRGYVSQRQRSEQVHVLHETGRVFQEQPLLEPAVLEYLDRLRATFNCERAALLTLEADGLSVVACGPGDRWSPSMLLPIEAQLLLGPAVREVAAPHRLSTEAALDTWILEWTETTDGMIAPVTTSTSQGVLVVSGHLGDVGGHGRDQVRLLGLLAEQLSVILDNRRLNHAATHDALTGLANRRLFDDRVRAAVDGEPGRHAVLLIDLDGFKGVNDTMGHAAGDEVLVIVARRLERAVRRTDLVARLGGDEFAVLLAELPDRATATDSAARVVAAVDQPILVEGARAAVGVSVGVAVLGAEDRTPERWLARADAALYRAKHGGKGRFELAADGLDPADV